MSDKKAKDATKAKKDKHKEEIKKLNEEIVNLNEELANSKNDFLKAYADLENQRKRLQSETDLILKYRANSLVLDLLPSLDNLERALENVNKEDSIGQGVEMVYKQLKSALEKEGVKEIEALDQEFDANLHQSIMMEKIEGVKSGIVVEVLQKGYLLKDRILRASLVKVSE
ncbi:MAG: nucleotide exchange factor GrpE [Erysipelotrichaceae bacterium]